MCENVVKEILLHSVRECGGRGEKDGEGGAREGKQKKKETAKGTLLGKSLTSAKSRVELWSINHIPECAITGLRGAGLSISCTSKSQTQEHPGRAPSIYCSYIFLVI